MGILVTVPLGTLPIRMFPVTIINKFDDIPEIQDIQRRAQRIFRDRMPSRIKQGPVMSPEPAVSFPESDPVPCQQAVASRGAGPGLGDQPSSFIAHQLATSINPNTGFLKLPPITGSTAPLRWAIDDMVNRKITCNIDGVPVYSTTTPRDIWNILRGRIFTMPIEKWQSIQNDWNLLEEKLRNGQDFYSVDHKWVRALKLREMSKNFYLDFHLTVLLLGETQENK